MNKFSDEISVPLEFIYDILRELHTLREIDAEFSELNENVSVLNKKKKEVK